jgi:hypothetical protein
MCSNGFSAKRAQLANKEVFDFITYWDVHRHDLPYETDGVVVSIIHFISRRIRYTAKFAMGNGKFKSEQVSTKLNSISYQVGRTGSITQLQICLLYNWQEQLKELLTMPIKLKIRHPCWRYRICEKGGEIPKNYCS